MRSILVGLAATAALVGGLAAPAVAAPAYTYTTVSLPGAATTFLTGINRTGTYTGVACNQRCTKEVLFVSTKRRTTEFKLHFQDFDPALPYTSAGIDTAGDVVGSYTGSRGVSHGFVRRPNGTERELNIPGASSVKGGGTAPEGISPDGVIVGWYIDGRGARVGFIHRDGGTETYRAPGASTTPGYGTEITFYLDGEFGGLYYTGNGAVHGFYVRNGTAHTLNAPQQPDPTRGYGTKLIAMSLSGALYGYVSSPGTATTEGFADHDRTFTAIRDPHQVGTTAADGTFVDNANGAGVVVGYYSYNHAHHNTEGDVKGFIAVPG